MSSTEHFDVFLCHNVREKSFVRFLVDTLRSEGYSVWLDEREFVAGDTIDNQVNDVIGRCKNIIVCVGRNGFGGYQRDVEIPLIKSLPGSTIIPLTAPGATPEAVTELQSHLPDTTLYVDLSGQPPRRFPPTLFGQLKRSLGPPTPVGTADKDVYTPTEQIKSSAIELANRAARDGLVVFLGGTWRENGEYEAQPDPEELAQYLLGQMATGTNEIVVPDYVRPSLEETARIFELREDFDTLQRTAVAGFVNARTARPSTRFGAIAEMLREITSQKNDAPAAGDRPPDRLLVFTTNIDLRLERSLIDTGTPFVRVVVMRGGEDVRASAFNEVRGLAEGGFAVAGDGASAQFSLTAVRDGPANPAMVHRWEQIVGFLQAQGVPPDRHPKPEDVQEAIRLGEILNDDKFQIDLSAFDNPDHVRRLPQLVIVKLLGSSGIPNSVALTSGQLLGLGDFAKSMPKLFEERLENAPKVFFGFSAGENMFQKIYSAFLRNIDCTRPKSFAIFESFAKHDDVRGVLERIVGSSRIDAALHRQLGLHALITRSSIFADAFMQQFGVASAKTDIEGDPWL